MPKSHVAQFLADEDNIENPVWVLKILIASLPMSHIYPATR